MNLHPTFRRLIADFSTAHADPRGPVAIAFEEEPAPEAERFATPAADLRSIAAVLRAAESIVDQWAASPEDATIPVPLALKIGHLAAALENPGAA